jgi:hypothetical protein
MTGVTTAIVLFLFACMLYPALVKNKPQYYAAFGMVCVILLLDALGHAFPTHLAAFAYFFSALLQIGAIFILFLAVGGLTPRELGDEMRRAFEVIRRGEEEKEIIIPLTGQQPRSREEEEAPQHINLTDPSTAPPPKRPDDSLPLD